ncbi:Altered inheritance of mitochondria protein 32 [Saxophila tyrrhenica]|uniref:Altered inheritance of mitochondria protein 32 n=1 Tax=Saxophila tyrrhenica TaxID=1690608 RepID=A0AAV9PHG8_9PEZI|nr:Altered inheritance of mitochondria protein 32 [Saxophila tyrrhenica]
MTAVRVMFIFRHGGRRAIAQSWQQRPQALQRSYASKIDIPYPRGSTIPTIEACPIPTCQCQETPSGLDIEREQNINGSMAAYAEQVLISTGKSDWTSKIEDEEDGVLVKRLKSFLGPKGKYSDPYHNVMLTNSSFAPTNLPTAQRETPREPPADNRSVPAAKSGSNDPSDVHDAEPASAFLLPSFQYVPTIPTDPASVEALIKGYIQPSQLHQSHDRLSRADKNVLLRQSEMQRRFVGSRKIDEILVLICGHGGRDVRCGTLGPILQREFEEKIERQNIPLLREAPVAEAETVDTDAEGYSPSARVGLISHIGGHKWAGNVIIYIPPSFSGNALAGKGIWYGRVAPEHVEGIVAKTILDGKVIKELFRGGVGQDREIVRL